MSTPFWITATPPATDGELHIGHLAGPYVAADVLSRYLRADGREVLFTTGTADHSSSVQARALRGGRKAEEVAEGYHAAMTADWLRSGVRFDRVLQPLRDHGYQRWVRELFRELHAQGVIVARTRPTPYCEPCGRWLHGAHVNGGCPHCGTAGEGGLCRACARPNDGGDLIDACCALCATPVRPRRCRRLYVSLEAFREPLAEHWLSRDLPPRLAALCEGLLEDGLPDVAVSQPGEWGITVPVEEFAGQRIDPGFEAAAMHLYGSGHECRRLPERAVHFCGFGHSFCHAVLLPAVLIAQGVKPEQDFCVNEDCRIGGETVTSGGAHAVWALDLLTEFGSDTLRRHVLQARPTGRRTDFDRTELAHTRRQLERGWNGWLARLFGAVREECGGLVPDVAPGGSGWQVARRRLARAAQDLRDAYGPEAFDPRRAVAVLDEVVGSIADFGHVNAHERRRTNGTDRHLPSLAAQLEVAAALTAWARPVMPEGADRLAAALRIAPGGAVTEDALAAPAPGTRLAPPSGPVFGF